VSWRIVAEFAAGKIEVLQHMELQFIKKRCDGFEAIPLANFSTPHALEQEIK